MTIEERMNRNTDEDKIEIGMIAERMVEGDKGHLLKALIEGIHNDYLDRVDRNTTMSAERALGVALGLRALQDVIEQCVSQKEELLAEKKLKAQEVKPAGTEEAPQG
jgi:hypothetical protein